MKTLSATDYKRAEDNLVILDQEPQGTEPRRLRDMGSGGGVSPTLNAFDNATESRATVVDVTPIGVRRLTPTECERLQGFPDGWTEGQSDSARYKQIGNAVAVSCVEWIVKRLVEQ